MVGIVHKKFSLQTYLPMSSPGVQRVRTHREQNPPAWLWHLPLSLPALPPCACTAHPSFPLVMRIRQRPIIISRTWLILSSQLQIRRICRLAKEAHWSILQSFFFLFLPPRYILGKMVRLCDLKDYVILRFLFGIGELECTWLNYKWPCFIDETIEAQRSGLPKVTQLGPEARLTPSQHSSHYPILPQILKHDFCF